MKALPGLPGIEWYDKEGKRLGSDYTAIEAKMRDPNYKIVKQEYAGKGGPWVSTVWLGLDHGWGLTYKPHLHRPVIFETMVFKHKGGESLDMERYCTEAEALAGHERMVKKWQGKRKASAANAATGASKRKRPK